MAVLGEAMLTYAILNAVFMASVVAVILIWPAASLKKKPLLLTGGIMLLLTAIFDQLLIATGIVAYDQSLLSGIYIGYAPIEDFSYTLVAVALIPYIWTKLGTHV